MSVTAAGFVAAGVASGIKPDGALDLSIVATADGRPVPAVAVFTRNKMTAAPVVISRQHLDATEGHAAAVILNSGNANAATGRQGEADAVRMCQLTADGLGCEPHHVLVCSTGLIGIPLPMDVIEAGVPKAVAARATGPAAAADVAEAIRTTDTHRKETLVEGDGFVVGGMAKGAAMLAPNMATMLAVLTTNATTDPATLYRALHTATAATFGTLTIDGCTSTNDTVILLANGTAEHRTDEAVLTDATTRACADLAGQMAADAEGGTKVVRITVTGGRTDAEASQAARQIADSQLCQCSWYGGDPYWGRIASELGVAGAAGIGFDPDQLGIAYGGITVARHGIAAPHNEAAVRDHMTQRHIDVTADLGLGSGTATITTTDLTHAYVDENMRTS